MVDFKNKFLRKGIKCICILSVVAKNFKINFKLIYKYSCWKLNVLSNKSCANTFINTG